MLKIGQIGIGHNHSDKIRSIQKYPELFELVGYAEENEDWIAKRGNKPCFRDIPRMSVEEILEKCDAVLVETDVWNLTKTAQLCVDAGKHIHMDKPASGTLAEYKHLLDTAEEKGLVVQLGYMYRYNPAIEKLLEMIKQGQLGQISAIHAEMSVRHSDNYRRWLRNFEGGDMYIFGCHLIDLIITILGEPNRVLSSIRSSGENGVEAPDLVSAILEYDHAIGTVFSSSVQWDGWMHRRFCVDGSLGTAQILPMEEPCVMTFAPKSDSAAKAIPLEMPQLPSDRRYDKMMCEFYAYVTGEKQNPFSYNHEYLLQKVLHQAIGG